MNDAYFPYVTDAAHLREAHSQEFQRLNKALNSGQGFRLLFVQFNQHDYRDVLVGRLVDMYEQVSQIPIDRESISDFQQLSACLQQAAANQQALFVTGLENWQASDAKDWLHQFNYQREKLAKECPVTLLFWLPEYLIRQFSLEAPDLWAWRAGVFDFTVQAEVPEFAFQSAEQAQLNQTEAEKRRQRIASIQELLESVSSSGLQASLLSEQGELYKALGDYTLARKCFEQSLGLYKKIQDEVNQAEVYVLLADLDVATGQLDRALEILLQHCLPTTISKKHNRDQAVIYGRIADILQSRGQLDEALKIREEEELSVYEQLGDVRSKAVTMGKIADILQSRGQLDEVLEILQAEVLPIFEQLGDVRSKAMTMGRIADILQSRGQLDEALKIWQTEQLAVYEQLGDVRSKAVTMGKIADILQSRGQLDEALKIREEEELPVYEQLGDVRELLVVRTKLAIILWQKDALQYQDEVRRLLCLALQDAKRLRIPEAGQIKEWLQHMGLSCD